jgi:hypothetical protein
MVEAGVAFLDDTFILQSFRESDYDQNDHQPNYH